MSFGQNISKNTGKNLNKNLSSKYSQKLLDHAKQSSTDTFKTASKWATEKNLKQLMMSFVMKLLIVTKVSRTLPRNSSDTVPNETEDIEHDKETPK